MPRSCNPRTNKCMRDVVHTLSIKNLRLISEIFFESLKTMCELYQVKAY